MLRYAGMSGTGGAGTPEGSEFACAKGGLLGARPRSAGGRCAPENSMLEGIGFGDPDTSRFRVLSCCGL
ncbi:MAG: hypothetical protein N2C12_09880 [Planctomycetales bacterium]